MPSLVFILLISVFSRIIWLNKYPVEDLKAEMKFLYAIFIFEVIWFMVCHFIFKIDFKGFPFN